MYARAGNPHTIYILTNLKRFLTEVKREALRVAVAALAILALSGRSGAPLPHCCTSTGAWNSLVRQKPMSHARDWLLQKIFRLFQAEKFSSQMKRTSQKL